MIITDIARPQNILHPLEHNGDIPTFLCPQMFSTSCQTCSLRMGPLATVPMLRSPAGWREGSANSSSLKSQDRGSHLTLLLIIKYALQVHGQEGTGFASLIRIFQMHSSRGLMSAAIQEPMIRQIRWKLILASCKINVYPAAIPVLTL
jgi:hypothetical protein